MAGTPHPGSAEASVILVLAPDGSCAESAISAVTRVTPSSSEVIVVANGSASIARFDRVKWASVRLVTLDEQVPFAAAANMGAAAAAGHSLCFVAARAIVTNGWLPPLLSAVNREGVGCAVAQITALDGRLLEAGCVLDREGSVSPLGTGSTTRSSEHLFPRFTDGGSSGCICVRRSSFVAAGGFDSTLDDLVTAGIDLSRALQQRGLNTVYEPASQIVVEDETRFGSAPLIAGNSPLADVLRNRWAATVPPGFPRPEATIEGTHCSVASRDAHCLDRILVITRSIAGADSIFSGRRVEQLLHGLAELVPDGRVTVMAMEGHNTQVAAPRLRRKGIEVVVAPEDWEDWLWRRPLLFSHIVVTDLPSLRRLADVLRDTQPQARRILCLPSLDFQDIPAARSDDGGSQDTLGRQAVVRHVQDQVALAAERFDAAWCATPEDRWWLAAVAPGILSAVIPTGAASTTDVPFDQRSGYVVLASPGADVAAGHADAALHAAQTLFPALLARDTTAFLRVVVDDPSPALQMLAGPNIELVPAGSDPARWFRRSRVCLACYPRGAGSRDAITLAIDSRTPFVTSRAAVGHNAPARLSVLSGTDDAISASLRAEHLHTRQHLWEEVHEELVRLADGPLSPATARLKLLRACADVGIAPEPDHILHQPMDRVDPVARAGELELRPRNVAAVGSAWKAAFPAPDGPVPQLPPPNIHTHWSDVPVNEQYERWCAVYGPTSRRLESLAQRLTGLVRRPKISIVMPVFNTEPSWLEEAISSMRSQVYENWELCIADDGSVNKGTVGVLEAHEREDARIRVIRLPGQQGIAAASNAALSISTGSYLGLLDHDDELKPHALGEIALLLDDQPDLDLIYTDEDKRDPDGHLVDPFFKPDWSPDHLMSRNYICHFLVLSRALLEKLQGFRLGFDGSQDYDLVLRATEMTTRIAHVAEPLYTWRKVEGSTAGDSDAKPWAVDAARRALTDALDRRGMPGEVVDGIHPTTYRVRYALHGRPKVSILIPTRDKAELLRSCIESVLEVSTYSNYEIVVVDNESTDPDTLAYLVGFPGRVVRYPHRFNYARMMNLAAHEATGDMLLFLNNDTRVVSPDWLQALIEHGQRPEVGIVGPRLLYPSGRPQHEGTIVGYRDGHAGNVDHAGYWGLGDIVRNCSAVTGACLLMRPSVYWEVGGHEERLRIAFNDVDLCLRVRQAGYQVVYTPYAELFHVEGGTRGIHAHVEDDAFFEDRWLMHKCQDPYYNPNFERRYPFRLRS